MTANLRDILLFSGLLVIVPGTFPALAQSPSASEAAMPAPIPSLDEVIAALERLDLLANLEPGQTPDPAKVGLYLESFRFLMYRDPEQAVTYTELHELLFCAENLGLMENFGYDVDVLPALLQRLAMIHEQVLSRTMPDNPTLAVRLLQEHFGQVANGVMDKDFIVAVASEPVVFEAKEDYVPEDESEYSRRSVVDWQLVIFPGFETYPTTCAIWPRDETVTWSGPMLSSSSPGGPGVVYEDGMGATIDLPVAPGDLFSPDDPLFLRNGTTEIELTFAANDLYAWGEPFGEDGGKSTDAWNLMKDATGPVRLEGTSPFGTPLVVTFSSAGFKHAFTLMNIMCASGELSGWLD